MVGLTLVRAGAGLALLFTCVQASADVLSFTGSMTAFGAAGPDPSCAPLPLGGTVPASTSSGTSSLGNFTYTHNICFNPAGGPFRGIFLMNFGTDAFTGTLNGTDHPDSTPGVADVSWIYNILAGTGRFAGASGTFTGAGTVDPRVFPAPEAIHFAGTINTLAVPEPGTWGMMVLGFGGLALTCRRYRRRTAAQL